MTAKQRKVLIRIIISAIALIVLFFIPFGESLPGQIIKFVLYLAVYLLIGYDILKKAFKGIKNRQVFDENFLMAIATIGAFALAIYSKSGDYVEAIAVMLFYQIGEFFQSYAVGRSRRSISELMDIRPDEAFIEKDGELVSVDPDEVPTGSVIVVRVGDKIPIDGRIISGSTTLNTCALTGESMPREAGPGDEVISGCINLTSLVKIETTREFGESTVSKILELVENSSSNKSRSENFISRFARIYTPVVCIVALALAIIPPIISGLILHAGFNFDTWIYRALTFLVISCPCALVISIPLTFFAGIGGASRAGVLVKGSNYLEALSKVDSIVMDKTGTLTKGSFTVTKIESPVMDRTEFLRLAAISEWTSTHPIAICLREAYAEAVKQSPSGSEDNDVLQGADDITEIGGFGVMARAEGKEILLGNRKLMDKYGISYTEAETAGSQIHMAVDGNYAGYAIVEDVLKETSASAINELRKLRINDITILTGDSDRAADIIAKELGISDVHSQLLPEDKVRKVEELIENDKHGTLAFVGDGINDAPVLSRADVGIAMGALGSDAAIEAADIVLMDDDPLGICRAIRISHKCMRIVYENIWFALGVKLICLILGAMGIANMWLAIFADVGVMIIAVL
ncbi:MAG: heavy metal translocating P-type ATPase, partial [Lachnospiraceae bacterium]|nr:heavy metal translocating P-type ATPase [Lachnospiraceae bacterium]